MSVSQESSFDSRFSHLRGVQWRINLGILPSSSSSSIEDIRRVAADYRRRYAGLRRKLLIDPPKDVDKVPDLVIDNPLSQNPDSMWGRFFRNAELEKMLDQDLSRLYPEHGSYFQTEACQAMLRRILLLWCLRHPEYGYRQGMHEIVAPLLYVLHVDVQHLSQVRELYEDQFCDKFDGISSLESNLACNYNLTKTSSPVSSKWGLGDDGTNNFQGVVAKVSSLDELEPDIGTIVLLSDAYGAEGELGILLSEKFMEHDAYCMFDALMSGAGGAVAMADYFSPSPALRSLTGLPPVIEASSALYHLLSIVDSSLHCHLIELGVEPQYFALRWLRVLFGREFLLEDLLIIWDEIFASPNGRSFSGPTEDDMQSNFRILSSPRGAFIAAIAVSMLLHLRSSLLATENATTCLQRLLNFPENINVKRFIEKAKVLQALALDTSVSVSPSHGDLARTKSASVRGYNVPSVPVSPRTPLNLLPESYWEEKWRVLHKAEEQQASVSGPISSKTKGSLVKERFSLSRTESDPSPTKIVGGENNTRSSVRRRLLEDLSHELGSEDDFDKLSSNGVLSSKDPLSMVFEQNGIEKNYTCGTEETCLSGHTASEDNSSVFSSSPIPYSGDHDHENDSEKSSVVSHLSIDDNDDETNNTEEPCSVMSEDPPLPESEPMEATTVKLGSNTDVAAKQATALKERKLLSGKFQWFWKFGRNNSEGASDKESSTEAQRKANVTSNPSTISSSSTAEECSNSLGFSSVADTPDKKVMGTLKNLGHSMLENIQVIESVFQQDRGQVGSLENLSRNILSGKGQVTAMAALKELRKISNLLSEM
ncbi:ypt/Rab-GAP domain of gyp1p superfamily protein [Tasmannia lanceolata]|uniref:ypt/Rab-GAP domain of gyp1p superfamily protein n=1 Tax=Tasmannia lanceolata TaxID=3420 RepID=UPI0040646050